MNKNLRHAKILGIIGTRSVLSQFDLMRKLRSEGVKVTQATLSRDLRELNLVKTADGYKRSEQIRMSENHQHAQRQTIVQFMTGAESAGNLVVVKTNPGNASPVARSLDTIGWLEIVGTVAGDDTILVVTRSASTALTLKQRLIRLAG